MTKPLGRNFLSIVLAAALLAVGLRGGSYDDLARGETFFLVWWILGLGLAFGLLPRTSPSRLAVVACAALFLLAAWTALGALWSESVGRTLHEASRTLGFAGALLLIVSAFGPRSWRRGVEAVTLTAIVVCCLAFASRVSGLTSGLEESGYVTRRLNYPFNYWNAVGVWAAMTVGLALAWSAHAKQWWTRAVALGGVCVAVPTAYLTYSRSAAVGVVIAVVAVVALSRHRWLAALHALLATAGSAVVILVIRSQPHIAEGTGRDGAGPTVLALVASVLVCALGATIAYAAHVDRVRLAPRIARGIAAAVVAAATLAAVVFGPSVTASAWESFKGHQEVTVRGDPARRLTDLSGERRNLWDAALTAFSEHPVHGIGAGTYEFFWNRDERWSHHVRDAHSLYFESLAELGLPGALLVLVALGSLLVAAAVAPFRAPDPPAAGAAAGGAAALLVYCVTAGVDWMWESTAVTCAAIACGGLLLAASGRVTAGRHAAHRVIGVALAVIAIGLQTPALIAASSVRSSQRAVREGRNQEALSAATAAVDAEPWSVDGTLQRALVLERLGYLDAAAKDARRGTEVEPTNAEMWLIFARIEVERGRVKAAVAAARKARTLNPRNGVFAAGG